MPFKDLRDYIDLLRSQGELAEVNAEVDWRYELGGVVRKNLDIKGPALLFNRIKGYRTPLFTCGMSTYERLAVALGMPQKIRLEDLVKEVAGRLRRPLPAEIVSSGPCKEVIIETEESDVLKFPVPLWQSKDGGRYLGTWHGVVTRDPETRWLNAGM